MSAKYMLIMRESKKVLFNKLIKPQHLSFDILTCFSINIFTIRANM